MPLYFDPNNDDLPFSDDVLQGLKQIEIDTRGIAVTPRIALSQIRQHLFPLLPREYGDVIDRLRVPTWEDVLFVFVELASRSEGTDKRLIEVAQAVQLIHSHSTRQPRSLAFPDFMEITYFLQMHDHARTPVRHLCDPDEVGNCRIYRFCKYCWRLAVPAKRLCPVHQPSTEDIEEDAENADAVRRGDGSYKEAARQKEKFDEALQLLLSAEVVEFHDSGLKADILFPKSDICAWLLKRRPALSRHLGNLLEAATDETCVSLLLGFLHDGIGMPQIARAAYDHANSMIQQHPALIWPMLLRAEAWYATRDRMANNWGGRRGRAGRKRESKPMGR